MVSRPILLFDGDCGFCSRTIAIARRAVQPRIEFVPWQSADLAALGVTADRADREVLWISPVSGTVHGGARALAAMMMCGRKRWWWVGLVLRTPPVNWIAHGVYQVVAKNRHRLPGGTTACALPTRMRHEPNREIRSADVPVREKH
jgi:predicted DCC family thiol-disulfide oxidoreductase YuxK